MVLAHITTLSHIHTFFSLYIMFFWSCFLIYEVNLNCRTEFFGIKYINNFPANDFDTIVLGHHGPDQSLKLPFFCEQTPAARVKAKMKLQLAETGKWPHLRLVLTFYSFYWSNCSFPETWGFILFAFSSIFMHWKANLLGITLSCVESFTKFRNNDPLDSNILCRFGLAYQFCDPWGSHWASVCFT